MSDLSFNPERAGRWMLVSGIIEPSGGMARYYRAAEQKNLPVSNEITGYAASTFAYLYRRTRNTVWLDAAVRTARFLTRDAWNPVLETFAFECAPGSPAYFFDCGIIVRGLLAVWRETGEPELLDIAVRCGRSMARDFLTREAIHPVVALPGRAALPYERRWSREPGCFQLKAALAWRNLASITGDAAFLSWWNHALRMALANDAAFLPGDPGLPPDKVMDRLHGYCYYLEAVLAEPGRVDCAAALRAGMERVSRHLHDIEPGFTRSDVYAQLLRVRLYAQAFGVAPLDLERAGQEAEAIASFPFESADPRLDGASSFGRRDGSLLPFANPVSTAFCMQASDLWRRRNERGFTPDLDELI